MNPLTPILAIVGLLVTAASGGPTNPTGWDPSWSLPLGALIALAAPGGVLSEDSRIVTWVLAKRWASDSQPPGVHVIVTALDD